MSESRPGIPGGDPQIGIDQWVEQADERIEPASLTKLMTAYLVFRALDTRGWREAVLAGLVLGFALCVKPSNAIFFFPAGLVLYWTLSNVLQIAQQKYMERMGKTEKVPARATKKA